MPTNSASASEALASWCGYEERGCLSRDGGVPTRPHGRALGGRAAPVPRVVRYSELRLLWRGWRQAAASSRVARSLSGARPRHSKGWSAPLGRGENEGGRILHPYHGPARAWHSKTALSGLQTGAGDHWLRGVAVHLRRENGRSTIC